MLGGLEDLVGDVETYEPCCIDMRRQNESAARGRGRDCRGAHRESAD